MALPSGSPGGMAGKPRQDREVATVFSPCLSGVVSAVFLFCMWRPPLCSALVALCVRSLSLSGCFFIWPAALFGSIGICRPDGGSSDGGPRSLHQDRRSPESRRCVSRVVRGGRRVRGSGKGAHSGSVGLGRKGEVSPHHTTRPASPRDLPAGVCERREGAGGWGRRSASRSLICLRRRRAPRWRRSRRRRARRAPRGGRSGRSPGRRRGPAARCCCC